MMRYGFLFGFVLLIFTTPLLFSQKETYQWYFGKYAGLDFSTNPPSALSNGTMNATLGCASISDSAGSLLFYTDGTTVWNQQHQVMANGTGLSANMSSSQSAVIIQNPATVSSYYIFTNEDIGNSKVAYSLVDMGLAAGMGSVTIKNYTLSTPVTEKITAVRHCNGIDTWVLVHAWNSNDFLAYLVSAAGVNTVPVISSVGSVHTSTFSLIDRTGCMKISPDGTRLALAKYASKVFEVFDFDNATGLVSNPMVLSSIVGIGAAYGCEFSPDGTKLYGTGASYSILYQWDLCAGSPTAISASLFTISTAPFNVGTLQLGPDGKIYAARLAQSELGVINNPNAAGNACNYVDQGQAIGTATSQLGLPNFVCDPFRLKPVTFSYTYAPSVSCGTVFFSSPPPIPVQGCTSASYSVTGQVWYFGDPNSGAANISTVQNPSHVYTFAGTYQVKLVLQYNCHRDTLVQNVLVTKTTPNVTLTGNYTLCAGGGTTTLTANGATNYLWSNGITSASVALSPSVSTVYTLNGSVTGNPCVAVKVLTVSVLPCLGIDEFSSNVWYKIYPNPFNIAIDVDLENSALMSVYNELGELVMERNLLAGKTHVQLNSLENGLYFTKLKSREKIVMLRIIKLD